MSTRERGIVNREGLVVRAISALYTGEQNPATQSFMQGARGSDEFWEEGLEDPTTDLGKLERVMLDRIGDPKRNEEVLRRALSHAKGILAGQKRSPERDERLGVVNSRLSSLR